MDFICCPDCGETIVKRMELEPERQILYWMCPECGTVHFDNDWVSRVSSKDVFDSILADTGKTGRFLFDSGIEVIGFERSSEESCCDEFISITECLQWFIDNQPALPEKEDL